MLFIMEVNTEVASMVLVQRDFYGIAQLVRITTMSNTYPAYFINFLTRRFLVYLDGAALEKNQSVPDLH